MTEEPIEKHLLKIMNALGESLDFYLNPNNQIQGRSLGFALLIFPFGEDPNGRINYISNSQRADMLVAMKEFIARAEGTYHENETVQ